MEIGPINRSSSSGAGVAAVADATQRSALRDVSTAVRRLNNLNLGDRAFTVAWNSEGHRYVVLVSDKGTGALLDQIPAENIVKMLSQLVAQKNAQGREPLA